MMLSGSIEVVRHPTGFPPDSDTGKKVAEEDGGKDPNQLAGRNPRWLQRQERNGCRETLRLTEREKL